MREEAHMANEDRRYWPDAGLTLMGLQRSSRWQSALAAISPPTRKYQQRAAFSSSAHRRWRLWASQPHCRSSRVVPGASSRCLSSCAFSTFWERRLRPFFLSVR